MAHTRLLTLAAAGAVVGLRRWPPPAAAARDGRWLGGTGERHAARPCSALKLARRPARATSTSSPGPATPRTARTDQTVDWVTPFEAATGLQGERPGRRHLRQHVREDGHRRLRRRLRVRRLVAADDLRGQGRAGEHLAAHQLRGHPRLPEDADLELRRWRRLRHAARLGRPAARLPHGQGRTRRPTRGASSTTRTRRTPARSPTTTRRPTGSLPRPST